jgi:hypothetical protein
MDKDKVLKEIKDTYSEIYILERKRVEVNKKLRLLNKHLSLILNYLRMEK